MQTKKQKCLLDSKINMLLNTKAKAPRIAEIPSQQLILFHLQPTFQELHCLVTSYRDITSYLFITSDPKRSDSIPS